MSEMEKAMEFLKTHLGGNLNVSTLTLFAIAEAMAEYKNQASQPSAGLGEVIDEETLMDDLDDKRIVPMFNVPEGIWHLSRKETARHLLSKYQISIPKALTSLPSEKINYVAGFCFDYSREKLALVLKNKPDWQKGKYNAIGGKVESGESPIDAMQREFKEETGADVWAWNLFCQYEGKDYIVHFFKAFSKEIENVRTIEEEQIRVFDLTTDELLKEPCINNLEWLIPLALDKNVNTSKIFDYGE